MHSASLFFLLVFLLGGAIYALVRRLRRPSERLQEVRASWGRPKRPRCDSDGVALYHQLLEEGEDAPCLDARTWSDLHLDAVFRWIDHAQSTVGKQFLYRALRTPAQDATPLLQRDRGAEFLMREVSLRERLQVELQALDNRDSAFLPSLFLRDLPERPPLFFLFPLLTLAAILCFAGLFFFPRLLLALILLALTNILIASTYRQKIAPWIWPLRTLGALLTTADRMQRLVATAAKDTQGGGGDALREVMAPCREALPALRWLRRGASWLAFEQAQSGSGDLMSVFYEYVNLLLLTDVIVFLFSLETIRRQQGALRRVYEAVGSVDVMLSLASLRHGLPFYTKPTFTGPAKALRIEGVVHPLIVGAVANSLEVQDDSVFITGSNMSGKTTFLRAVAVNVVLAQTLYTCLATEYEAPLLQVRSCIGRTDNLSEGKSYYLAEVERIGEFLTAAAAGPQYLFVLDEIYRGTNTVERVAAARAVLDSLNRDRPPHLVFVTTHDVEISHLLRTRWARFHFREAVEACDLVFDYLLRPGTSSTRNALRLLEASGYPAAVVADARAAAEEISRELPSARMVSA